MKRWCLAAVALAYILVGRAQSHSDEFGYPDDDQTDDYAPIVRTDTSLFYNSVRVTDDLYARMAGHRLSFVRTQRQMTDRRQVEMLYAGLSLPADMSRPLRSLGAERRRLGNDNAYGAATGSEAFAFAPVSALADPASAVGVTFADKGYCAGLDARFAAGLGRGWQIAASIDARTGRDLHIDGVFTNSAGVAARAAKTFADGSELSLLAAVEPSMRGLRTATTDEACRLTQNRLYNPSWGRQNGRQRNSRVQRDMMPAAVLSYSFAAGRSTTVEASAAVRAGTRRRSRLGWYDAATPMPDNYRCMPSYFTDAATADEVAESWRRNDERYTQIDWAELYEVNRISDRGAVYAVEDQVRRTVRTDAAVRANTSVGHGLTVSYGVQTRYDSQRCYRQMRDLLGAAYLLDIDYYLVDDDAFANSLQNDLRNPNRTITEGDRFGYDYALRSRRAAIDAAAEYTANRFDLSVAGRLGAEAIDRRGRYEKELFVGSGSYGRSAVMRFATYNAVLTAGWTFSPRYRAGLSLRAEAHAPDADGLFLNPQYNNRTVDNPVAVRTNAAEINFRAATAVVQMQASLFALSRRNDSFANRYYDDLAGEFCDMTVSGINMLACGIEAAAAIRLARRWHTQLTVSAMQCRYTSDPEVKVYADRDNRVIDAGSSARLGDCTAGNTPRFTATVAVGYRSFNGWSADIAGAWVGARRAEASFIRRTERVAYQGASSPEAFAAIVTQQRLPDAFTIDMNVSKRWSLDRTARSYSSVVSGRHASGVGVESHRLRHPWRCGSIKVMLSVRNLTGERGNIIWAYESERVRRTSRGIQTDYTPLPTRLLYGYPRTVVLSATYTF